MEIKKIGVFTSGGDAPGMNACLRAVTRAGIHHGLEMVGIKNGYSGVIDADFINLESHLVGNIIHRGGTILKTARSKRFLTEKGMAQAYESLKREGIEAVVAIGGDGTFRGANEFTSMYDIPFIGIPATIDNDMFGTDFTIGYDTALNTVVQAVDKIRDTADAHNRLFIVEVMGKDAGFIALRSGIAVGAEAVLVPETDTDLDSLLALLERGWKSKKTGWVVIVAEGDDAGGAFEIGNQIKEKFGHFDIRVSVLGHQQRGGAPSCMDRVLATRLGVGAIDGLLAGKYQMMVGVVNNEVCYTDFDKATKHHKALNKNLLNLVNVLGQSCND
ncbi:MAG: 6-phosphofructokinase [Flavobacteriales bacterium]|nr:6-phosphofructokinase [Flavobacteriales bacterium]